MPSPDNQKNPQPETRESTFFKNLLKIHEALKREFSLLKNQGIWIMNFESSTLMFKEESDGTLVTHTDLLDNRNQTKINISGIIKSNIYRGTVTFISDNPNKITKLTIDSNGDIIEHTSISKPEQNSSTNRRES